MSTFSEKYEEYIKKHEESGSASFIDRYLSHQVESGKLDLEATGTELSNRVNSWVAKNDSLIDSYNSRYSGGNSAYRADSADWLSSVTTQKSELESEAESIRQYLDFYGSLFSDEYVTSVKNALDGNLKVQESILSAATEDNNYWSQWENEAAYNEYLTWNKEQEELKSADLGALREQITVIERLHSDEELSKDIFLLKAKVTAQELALWAIPDSAKSQKAQAQAKLMQYKEELSKLQGVEENLANKRAYLQRAENAQKIVDFESVADISSPNYDPEFAHKSGYVSTFSEDIKVKTDNGLPYKDLTYEYINNQSDGIRAQIKHTWQSSRLPIENILGISSQQENSGYDYMTDEEIAVYNYYYSKNGKASAEEYLESLSEILQARMGNVMADFYMESPVLEYMFGVEAGLDQFSTGVANLFSDEDYYAPNATQVASGIVREDLGELGPEFLGSSLGQIGYDAVTTTSNMLPSILTSAISERIIPGSGAVVGSALLGASAAGNAKTEMINLGYSKQQATAYGMMVGVSESSLQYLLGGVTKLGGVASNGLTELILSKVDNAFARVAIQLGGGMLSEGVEEGLQTVIEPWLKSLATGVDWESADIEEVLYSSLLGAISSLGLEGGGVALDTVSTYNTGKSIKKTDDGVEKLQNIANTFSADTVAYKIASRVNEQTDAYTIGRLFNEVGATLSEQNVTEITNGLIERGMDAQTAKKLAKQYQSILNSGMAATAEQIQILQKLSPLADVLIEDIIGANTTPYQRTQAFAELNNLTDKAKSRKKNAKTSADEVKQAPQEAANEVTASKNTVETVEATEGIFKASEDGKTINRRTGEYVNISEVVSNENGALKLKLEDGEVVDATALEYSSPDEALLYEMVADMGVSPKTATALIRGYHPTSGVKAQTYAIDIPLAYWYGRINYRAGLHKLNLTSEQASTAFVLGQDDARAEATAKNTSSKENTDNTVSRSKDGVKKGKVILEGDVTVSHLNKTQKASLKAIEVLCEALGKTFHVFSSELKAGKRQYRMPSGEITSANGWYDVKTGEIWIDINAGSRGEGTVLFTAAHELTHDIRQNAPLQFKALADFLMEQYGEHGVDVQALIDRQIDKARRNGRDLSFDEAYEEVVADSFEVMLADGNAVEKIAQLKAKDKGLWQTVKDFFSRLAAKIKRAYAGLSPDSREGQYVAEWLKTSEKLRDMWAEAVVEASDTQTATNKNTSAKAEAEVEAQQDDSDVEEVRYSFRNSTNGTAHDKLSPYNEELTRFIHQKGDFIVDSFDKLKELVNLAFDNTSRQATAYFGIIDSNSLAYIQKNVSNIPKSSQNILFKPGRDYSIAVTLDSIRHLADEKSLSREDIIDYLDRLSDTILEFDSVDFHFYEKGQSKTLGLLFKKSFSEGILTSFELISKNKRSLVLQTLYLDSASYQKKKSANTLLMQNANSNTSKTQVGQTSDNRIPQNPDSVNISGKKFSEVFSENNIKRSEREISKSDIDALRTIPRKSINAFTSEEITKTEAWAKKFYAELGTKSPFFRAWFGDWRGYDTKEIPVLSLTNKEGKNPRGSYQNSDTGWDITSSSVGYDETISHSGKDKMSIIAMKNMDKIIENSILLDTEVSEYGRGKKSVYTAFMHKFYSFILIDGKPFIAKMSVDESFNPGHTDTNKKFYHVRSIKIEAASSVGIGLNHTPIIEETASNIIISDLYRFVKSHDKDFSPKKANPAFLNKNGTPKVFHFVTEKSGEGMSGLTWSRGVRLFADRSVAQKYGGEIMPMYVSGASDHVNRAPRTVGEGDAVVYSPVQIKSATENIGTFDGANPDIRYSEREISQYSYDYFVSKPDMKVIPLSDNVPKSRADIVSQAKKNAAKIGKFNANDNSVSVHVDDINTEVVLGTRGLIHGLDRRLNEIAPITVNAGEIIQNSIRINELVPDKENADASYVLIGVATDANSLYIVRSIVNRYSSELSSMDVLYAMNAKKGTVALDAPLLSRAEYRSTISISQLLEYVNKYFPDVLPESVLRHFGYDARPEGKIGESALFSERDPDAVSNRSLLANALMTAAKNDIEKNKLAEYKKKIVLIEAEQEKLSELRAEIKGLSFAKGKRDVKRISELREEATKVANRINTYDRQLLSLEATAALKNVLEREKTIAYKKAERLGKEALAKYRRTAAKKQKELMQKHAMSRKRAVEGRNATQMRHKIKKVAGELNTLLLDPTKERHVPIELQRAVAEALDIINMDTVGADARVAKYNALIANTSDPEMIAELTRSRDRIASQGENLADRLTSLKAAYASIKNSDDPLIKNSHSEAIENLIEETAEKVGSTSLRDMSLEQLEAVYDMYEAILSTVRNANKMLAEEMQETVSDNAASVKDEIQQVGNKGKKTIKEFEGASKFGWSMLKPIYAMRMIGSKTLTRLYENVRRGEDTWAIDVSEAKAFFRETAQKYGYKNWELEGQHTFTDSYGNNFSISLEQLMSLYAYSKREQADKHLELGGLILEGSVVPISNKATGKFLHYKVNDTNPYRLNKDKLTEITSSLTAEQRGFVDEMQAYLSDVMGAKGNEVSLAMYGIKLYKEQNYFPLKTARHFREFDPEKNATPKIKNSGFSKKTVPQAGNPIVLTSFMDVWANHVNDMSMYHAFVLPLEDFMRVYNYSSTQGGYDSVKQYLTNAYGNQAGAYIERLMEDLGGGARSDPMAGFVNKSISLFKKAAVFASASVVIQQPSAGARAMAYIDPKYFVGKPDMRKHTSTWAEVKKYAPVAIIKEMGYFDVGMGSSTVDFIKENEYDSLREKLGAIFTDANYRDEIFSKAPALADEITWCAIWNAVKREIANTTNLEIGSEAFLKKAGERFTEVITLTQVYDSVLSRSGLMRSKDSAVKMATAFMAEPTTTSNMIVDAILQGKRGNKKFTTQAIGAVAASIIINSLLVSLVYAARDDDEDETYAEKYLSSLTSELIDGFNPITYIPFVKDAWSIAQGFDVERSDMTLVGDLWQSVENLFSEDRSIWEKIEGVVGTASSLFGLPFKNLLRDGRAIYNLFNTFTSGTKTTDAGILKAVKDAATSSVPLWDRFAEKESKSDRVYDAIISGNTEQIYRMKLLYGDEYSYDAAVKQGLRDNDARIREAAQARYDADISEYKRIAKEIINEGHFSQDIVVAAINAEINAIKKEAQKDEVEETESDLPAASSIFKASDINDAFENGDNETALAVINELIAVKIQNNLEKARKEAEKNGERFNEATARKEAEAKAKSSLRSSMTSYWKEKYKEAYRSKNTAEKERIERILKASGLYGSASDVMKTCREWRTEKD